MRVPTIQTRLTFWYASVLSIALIIFSLAAYGLLSRNLHSELVSNLRDQSAGLGTYLKIEDSDPEIRLVDEIDEYSRSLTQKHLLTVRKSTGDVVYTNWAGGGRASSAERSGVPFTIPLRDGPYLGMLQSVELREGRFETLLAIPIAPSQRAVSSLRAILIFLVPCFIAIGVFGGYWLSRKALEPVVRITERARLLGIHDLSERLPSVGTGDELQRLTDTWNSMLDRIERAVSKVTQFTADASHELRTPIAVIRLAAENALRRERSAEEYRDALVRIQRESESMTTLIEDLLFLARSDAKLSRPSLDFVSIPPLVEDACRDLAPLAEAKQIRLTQECPSSTPPVVGSAEAVRRTLRILLDNAIKYTPSCGSVRIHLEQEGANVALRVTDNGIGIPEELRARVFERFYRADPSRNRGSGGNGLGLAIASAILAQYEGTISVEDNAEGGATFSVFFPIGSDS